MKKRSRQLLFSILFLATGYFISAFMLSTVHAATLLVRQGVYSSGYYSYGYPGGGDWGTMTSKINTAFGGSGNVTKVANFDSATLTDYDAIWVDVGNTGNSTLSSTEISKIQAFIATGKRIVLIGENSAWNTWNNSILSTVGGTTGSDAGTSTYAPIYSHALTTSVTNVYLPAGGAATSGTSLFTPKFATLWGDNLNVFVMLDINVFSNTYIGNSSNNQFAQNTVDWLATPVDSTAPTVSSVSVTPSTTSATITWSTNEASSSIIDYGLTNSVASSTSEADTSPRVTSHNTTVSGLISCSTYYYRVRSKDAAGNAGTSSTGTFTTTGCTGSATVNSESTSAQIATGSGGSATHSNSGESVELTIPASYSGTAAYFQIKQIDKTSVLTTTSTPTSYSAIGNMVYDFRALTAVDTQVTSFSQPITVEMTYTDADASGMDESTFWIYKWNGTAWVALSSCAVDASSNTTSCTTTSFSTFALFGQTASSPNTSSSSTASSPSTTCTSEKPTSSPSLFQIDSSQSTAKLYFTPIGVATGYTIEYGTNTSTKDHSTTFDNSDKSGALTYTVNNLTPNTIWYFKVRGNNGCAPGPYSQVKSASTTTNSQTTTQKVITTLPKVVGPNTNFLNPQKKEIEVVEEKVTTSSSTPCTHTIEAGDTLWKIAENYLGDGSQFKKITEINADKVLGVSLKIGNIISLPCESNTKSDTESNEPQTPESYDVKIRLTSDGKALGGANVEIHSDPMKTTADDSGVANFSNVPPGEHTIKIAYKGYTGEHKIALTGLERNIDIDLAIKLTQSGFASTPVQIVIAILSLTILAMTLYIAKNRKAKA